MFQALFFHNFWQNFLQKSFQFIFLFSIILQKFSEIRVQIKRPVCGRGIKGRGKLWLYLWIPFLDRNQFLMTFFSLPSPLKKIYNKMWGHKAVQQQCSELVCSSKSIKMYHVSQKGVLYKLFVWRTGDLWWFWTTRRVGMRALFRDICLCFGQFGSQGML